MHAHERRVIEEKKELDERLVKLAQFIASSAAFKTLDEIDQRLMWDQRDAMMAYSDALDGRIDRFMA